MPCGLTKTASGQTVTCDNSGTTSHTGLHSGVMSIFWGLASIRVTWAAPDVAPARHKAVIRGDTD